jgi:hypothetical protein
MIWGREIYCMKKNGDGIYDESLIQTVVLGGIQVSNMYNIFFC